MKRHWSKEFGPAYFITNTVCEWKNIFVFDPYVRIILNSWKHFQTNRRIEFFGFVIMPSHLHYVAWPQDEHYGIVEMQRDFKKYTAKRILDGLSYELEKGMFPMIDIFREKGILREPAPELLRLFKLIGKYSRQDHKVWMPEDKPEAVTSVDFLRQKLDYIHYNPVRAGLVERPEDYPFSSARNYYLDDDSLLEIARVLI